MRPTSGMACVSSLTLFSLLALVSAEQQGAYNIPHYFVIGQQRSGTSALWMLMKEHPELNAQPKGHAYNIGEKEPFYFIRHREPGHGHREKCDNNVSGYLELFDEEGKLGGDHTAAQLACHCCPDRLSRIAPKAKVVAILRDPVQRALSRYTEMKIGREFFHTDMPGLTPVVRATENFAEYADKAVSEIVACMDPYYSVLPMTENFDALREEFTHRCLGGSNIVGFSAYSTFLKQWLKFYPPEQTLVLYSSQLEADPLGTMRRIESHLGISQHKYSQFALENLFNTKEGGYGNSKALKRKYPFDGNIEKKDEFLGRVAVIPEDAGNLTQLYDFYKPYMKELLEMAQKGLIAEPPIGMMAPYMD